MVVYFGAKQLSQEATSFADVGKLYSPNWCFLLLFFSLNIWLPNRQDGEEVRFNIHTDETGRKRAADVTGPDGGYVQGAPKRRFDDDSYDSY